MYLGLLLTSLSMHDPVDVLVGSLAETNRIARKVSVSFSSRLRGLSRLNF